MQHRVEDHLLIERQASGQAGELQIAPLSLRGIGELLRKQERAHSFFEFFELGQFSTALLVCWDLIEELKARRDFGCLALAQILAADCLAILNDQESVLSVLMDALDNANKYGGDDLLAHVELRHTAYLMTAGSLRTACALLNAIRRRRPTWKDRSDQFLQLDHLGHCYRLLRCYDFATSCFDRELAEAADTPWAEEVNDRTQLGRAAVVIDQGWSRVVDQLCTTYEIGLRPNVSGREIDQLKLAGVLLERSPLTRTAHDRELSMLRILSRVRLAILQSDTNRALELLSLLPLPTDVQSDGVSVHFAQSNQIHAVLQLVLGKPSQALAALSFRTIGVGDICNSVCLANHRLAAIAAKQTCLYSKALEHALEAQRFTRKIAATYSQTPESPAFLACDRTVHLPMSLQQAPSRILQGHGGLVERAIQLIEIHMKDRLTHNFLSSALGISTRTLQHAFSKELKTTPMQFIKRKRIEKARQLILANSGLSLRSIAEDVGMPRIGTFIANYRNIYGEMPSDTVRRCSFSKVDPEEDHRRNFSA